MIGHDNYEILRFFILANKAQLITLPDEMHLNIGSKSAQFLITSVSPESELIFRNKRESCGVKWLWHGSRAERWYRILHTGLKDLGNTIYQFMVMEFICLTASGILTIIALRLRIST